MPRLCYGSAEQVNLLCSLLNRKVQFSVNQTAPLGISRYYLPFDWLFTYAFEVFVSLREVFATEETTVG